MLKKNTYLKNILTLATGSSIAQLIPILISPILTRLYSPEQFGELAFFLGVCSILSILVTGRYELAIVLPKNEGTAWHTFVLSLCLAILLCFFLSIVIFINYETLQCWFESKIGAIWLYLIPLYTLLLATHQSYNYWNTRHGNFTLLASNRVLQTGVTGSNNLFFGYIGGFSLGLVYGSIIGAGVSLLRVVCKSPLGRKLSFTKLLAVSKKYSNFPKFGMFSSLFNTCSSQAPVLLLSALFSTSVAGFYSLANRILVLPMSVLGGAVGQAYLNQITLNKGDNNFVKELTQSTVLKLYYIGFIPMLLLAIYGDCLFAFVFGNQWSVAGEYAQLLTPWMFLVFITSPISNLLICYEKQKESLIFNFWLFAFRISALFFGWFFFNEAYLTTLIFTIVGFIFWFGFLFYLLKIIDVKISVFFKHFLLFIICLLILFLVRYGVDCYVEV